LAEAQEAAAKAILAAANPEQKSFDEKIKQQLDKLK